MIVMTSVLIKAMIMALILPINAKMKGIRKLPVHYQPIFQGNVRIIVLIMPNALLTIQEPAARAVIPKAVIQEKF